MIYSLMRMGFTYLEARDMSPDESDRYLALHLGHTTAELGGRNVAHKATQADIDAFFGAHGG